MPTQSLALYNPYLLPPDVLLAEFTARRPLLDTLLDIIRHNAPGQPPQHVVLIGSRGMGKTTMLWAIAHSINRDSDLYTHWQPVVFDEESRRVGDLTDFWLEAIRQWEHATSDSTNRTEQLLKSPEADIEKHAQAEFLKAVDGSGRRALLLIDNLNELLGAIHDPEPLHRLRAFLMEDPRVMIIGTAIRRFEEITDLDQPFYDFFRRFELQPLTLEEMKSCLLVLAKRRGDESMLDTLEKRAGTIQALHLLTGGNPRLVKTFYRLLAEGLRGDIRADLEQLLDEFTPYFKAIVDALPVQQQRIFDAVALAWDPVEVAAITHQTRLASNKVSAQLGALVKAGLVAEAAGSPKRKTYLLADRFSNIHYLMRHGRAARNRFDWFVALVKLLFPDEEHTLTLAKLAHQSAEYGVTGENDAKNLLLSALNRAESADSCRKLIHATINETWDKETLSSLSKWMDLKEAKKHLPEMDIVAYCTQIPIHLRKALGYQPNKSRWWHLIAVSLEQKHEWTLALAAYRKAIELNPKDSYAWYGMGQLFHKNLGGYAEFEREYLKAIEHDSKSAYLWNALGNLLKEDLGRYADSQAAYRKAIELDPSDAHPWWGLGTLFYVYLNRYSEAEAAFRKAIEVDPKSVDTWNGLGSLLTKCGRYSEAEAAYRKGIEIDPKFVSLWHNLGLLLHEHSHRDNEAEAAYRKANDLNPKHAPSWNNLGNLLRNDPDRYLEAEEAYRKDIELYPSNKLSWYNLGNLLQNNQARYAEAKEAYQKAIEIDPKFSAAWNNLGHLLQTHMHRYAEAEIAFQKSIELDPKNSSAWGNLGALLQGHLARYMEAETAYLKSIEVDPENIKSWTNLGNLLQNQLARYTEAETAFRKAIELDPQSSLPWSSLGNLLQSHLGRYVEAEAAYRKAIELDPKHSITWNNLGNVLQMHLPRYAEAETAYLTAIELDPKYATPWINLGRLLHIHLHRYTEAEAAYQKAIALDSRSETAWINLGHLLQNQLARYEEAETVYRKAIEINPDAALAWNNLARLLHINFNRGEEADEAYRKAIKLDPKFPNSWSGLAELLASIRGREEEARACAIKALIAKPDFDYARGVFTRLCSEYSNDWRTVLPDLATWCTANPMKNEVFEFTVEGFLRLARLTKPADVVSLLDALPEPARQPFETLRDAFLAVDDHEHLNRLAPERRSVAIELINRLSPPKAVS